MSSQRGRGRPAVSSREEIEAAAMRLFRQQGFSATTVAQIAAEAGVSRSSVFRYWGSKSDIVWSEFSDHTRALQTLLEAAEDGQPVMRQVHQAVVENFLRSTQASPSWLDRFAVLDSTDELGPESAAQWAAWADVVATHVARSLDLDPLSVPPRAVGAATQAAFLTTLRRWVAHGSPSISDLDNDLEPLSEALQNWLDGLAA